MSSLNTKYSDLSPEVMERIETKYANLQFITEGGFGVLLSGVTKTQNQPVVLKVILLRTKAMKTAFLRETKIYKILKHHPTICKLKKATILKTSNEELPRQYGLYVMEKMDCDLLDYILESPIRSETQLREIFKSICKAVENCHSQNIVHLDLKPDNILLKINKNNVDSGDASTSMNNNNSNHHIIHSLKLCDFGSAQRLQVTNAGQIMPERIYARFGTSRYLPPECMEKFHPNTAVSLDKVDIYSLGVILFILITNTFPKLYNEENGRMEVLALRNLEALKILVSSECYDLVWTLMNDDPSLRPTIQEVLLHPFFSESPTQPDCCIRTTEDWLTYL